MAPQNEWTLLFFFAGDDALSPLMISELKAIKDAGFQRDTTVLAHFDPNPLGAPTQIYNVNRRRKDARVTRTFIGDGKDPFVRNLIEDKVNPNDIDGRAGAASSAIRSVLNVADNVNVETALRLFLGFARETHRAKHYMLFLIGHGMVVANDAFLPDENPVSALTLNQLDDILRGFSKDVREKDGGDFELLALHSCSMSSIEVAYQLKGTANYMMATEGLAFVMSWPYRQLLKKTFNAIENAKSNVDIPALIEDIFDLSLHNGTDFMTAGYSGDLQLCKLQKEEVEQLNEPLTKLVAALKRGLGDNRVTQLILLAHWKSQSYWQETFTDLSDFCQCLSKSCDNNVPLQKDISTACENVMTKLKQVVRRSDSYGPTYQYSHGLSIYFPWSRPLENVATEEHPGILQRYQNYAFTYDLKEDAWFTFLDMYFDVTKRGSRKVEDSELPGDKLGDGEWMQLFEAARESFNPFGVLADGGSGVTLEVPDKPLPSVGLSCSCPSIKNHPQETEKVGNEAKLRNNSFSITQGALEAFTMEVPPE